MRGKENFATGEPLGNDKDTEDHFTQKVKQ